MAVKAAAGSVLRAANGNAAVVRRGVLALVLDADADGAARAAARLAAGAGLETVTAVSELSHARTASGWVDHTMSKLAA